MSADKHEARSMMCETIRRTLMAYPDLAGDASAAINAGVQAAVDRIQEDASAARLAMVAALALLPPNRITDNGRSMLEEIVRRAISATNRCPAEVKFMERP